MGTNLPRFNSLQTAANSDRDHGSDTVSSCRHGNRFQNTIKQIRLNRLLREHIEESAEKIPNEIFKVRADFIGLYFLITLIKNIIREETCF